MPNDTDIDWKDAWSSLRDLDDEQWDAENERLNKLWIAQYTAEFIDYAMGRSRWDRQNAEDWADELAVAALIDHHGDPKEAARKDVVDCELQT